MEYLHCATSLLFYWFLLAGQIQLSCCRKTHSNTSCIDTERIALLKLRESLIDKSNRLSSWFGEECCSWEGVGCSKRTGNVVKLDLRNRFPFDPSRYFYDAMYADSYSRTCLGGKINDSFLKLEHLHYLDLSMNNFSGVQIPSFFGSLRNLRYLDLSSTGFEGMVPHDLGNLTNLKYLNLGESPQGWITDLDYVLTAKNFWWVAKLSSLESLDLSGIHFEDTGDWLHAVNMLPSLLSLTLAGCDLRTVPSISNINFTSLNSLDLSGNDFNSQIPLWLSNISSLVNLHLENNYLYGPIPDSFSGMITSLAFLDLSSNSFRTSFPTSLCNLSNLTYLYLSLNHFQGSLPSCLGKLSSLNILHLHSNEFSGTIPTSLGQLTKLQRIRLSNNRFDGMLSEVHFDKLTELKFLDVSSTLLTWNVSSMWIPPFQLQYIHTVSTKIGPQFPAWLQTQNAVNTLIMSNGSISDAIPDWFQNVYSQIHYLDLSNNDITGKPPEFKEINTFDRVIILYSNKFQGSLNSFPPNAMALDASMNLLTGNIPPLGGNTKVPLILRYLHLSDNLLTGSIPDYICSIQTLSNIDLSNNQLTGRVPLCLGNLQQLKTLNLRNNNLSGYVPSSLGSMEALVYLLLSGNKFQGKLPQAMQNLKNLEILDLGENGLTGIIPAWIGNGLTNLRILRLQSNNLSGDISILCHLQHLQVLNLAQNKLAGEVPTCFGNLSAMVSTDSDIIPFSFYLARHPQKLSNFMKGRELEYSSDLPFLRSMDLSGNNLVGEIPQELMNLVGLQSLALSNNHFNGKIPEKIGDLKQLESLDLSSNQLSGTIPQSLSTITSLSYLNLSFNSLSGRIPSGNQLQTITSPDVYEGNTGLCGKPLPNICPGDKSSDGERSIREHEAGKKFDVSWFYAGTGPGFGIGFSAVCVILTFKKSWRQAYFQFVENVYNRLLVVIQLKISKLCRKFQ